MTKQSLKYYHEKVKPNPEKMAKRKQYYRDYYRKNKKVLPKIKKSQISYVIYGEFILVFD